MYLTIVEVIENTGEPNMMPNTIPRKPSFYYGYIRSVQWKAKRNEQLRAANWRCEHCHVAKATVVHHLDYDRLGEELPEDLMALCYPCHEQMHAWPRAANDNQLTLAFEDTG
jgi:5-methylcytosine-specific restriction endonuclease McrA